MTTDSTRVCPVENAGGLDNKFRRWLQNPHKILRDFVKPGITVMDYGCGPGFFSVEIAKMLNGSGKLYAVDLQDGMLNIVRNKIEGTVLEDVTKLHQCSDSEIGLVEKVDFILAFYVIHEIQNKDNFFVEVKKLLNPGGKILIVEPKFHVNKQSFITMERLLDSHGFKIIERPSVFFSRACVYTS
jgi:ubiquinone/menaquinone biosynthesis C-methylase UbiE